MPSTRPQACFVPLPPGLDLESLVDLSPNFEWVVRVHCDMVEHHGQNEFEKLILRHVVQGGKPLVIEGYEAKLDQRVFSVDWLNERWGSKAVVARDLTAGKNERLSIQHYLRNMTKLTNQWNERNYRDSHRQRMYLKDIDCHPIWEAKVRELVPSGIFYMNERADKKIQPSGTTSSRLCDSAVVAGDLMSSLPVDMRAENLMCYIGHEGTYTPAHREMCASLGQNIMVEASADGMENGRPTQAGSSIWFMTETKDRDVVSEYWLSRLGHDIEVEKHFAQINAWKQAPFQVYVVEQKPGDFVVIPPLAPHQVWNRGTRTMKVAWNRTTVDTLEMALDEALFKARMVCRDEQYKNKAIIFYSLQKYSHLLELAEQGLQQGEAHNHDKTKIRQLLRDFKRLHSLFSAVLVSESFTSDRAECEVEMLPFEGNVTCSYCRCNIFNRFLTCPSCVGQLQDGSEDTYDVCLDCYAMGRSCLCISGFRWVEQWSWSTLSELHEIWRRQIMRMQNRPESQNPVSLADRVQASGRPLTLAQVCQNELARRPFHDISKDQVTTTKRNQVVRGEDDQDTNIHPTTGARLSKEFLRDHARCHVDCHWEPKWKQACCNDCGKSYCFGVLFRAYDELPQNILANPDWKCPSCRKICSCRKCVNKSDFKRYTPKGTLLGHDTKLVADPRSVESLVDFSHDNISWIRKAGDDHEEDTLRMRRKLRRAEVTKAENCGLTNDNIELDGSKETDAIDFEDFERMSSGNAGSATIDPALLTISSTPTDGSGTIYEDHVLIENPEVPQLDEHMFSNDMLLTATGSTSSNEERPHTQPVPITYHYPDILTSVQVQPETMPEDPPATASENSLLIKKVAIKRKRSMPKPDNRPQLNKKTKLAGSSHKRFADERELPNADGKSKSIQQGHERLASNTPIQASQKAANSKDPSSATSFSIVESRAAVNVLKRNGDDSGESTSAGESSKSNTSTATGRSAAPEAQEATEVESPAFPQHRFFAHLTSPKGRGRAAHNQLQRQVTPNFAQQAVASDWNADSSDSDIV